jgi:phage protein D
MPTSLTPIYRIIKGGDDITGHFNDRTTKIHCELKSGNGESDRFEVQLDDRDFRLKLPQTGAKLNIELGYKELGLSTMGSYQINEIYLTGTPKSMRLVGLAAGMKGLMKSPAIKEFDNKTIGDIVKEMAKKGKAEAVIDPELGAKKLPFLNQFNSNFHLLHELERRFGAVAKFANDKLIFKKRDDGEAVGGDALPMLVLLPHHFGEWSVKITDRPDYTSVKAAWWDKDQHKRVFEEEKNGAAGDQAKQGDEDTPENPFIFGPLFNSKEEAKAAAKARVEALQRATGEVTVDLAKGDPWVKPQMPLIIRDMREGINGSYIIDTVIHTYVKDAGIKTRIVAKPPGDGNEFTDESNENYQAPLAGETMGGFGDMFHRQPGPI